MTDAIPGIPHTTAPADPTSSARWEMRAEGAQLTALTRSRCAAAAMLSTGRPGPAEARAGAAGHGASGSSATMCQLAGDGSYLEPRKGR